MTIDYEKLPYRRGVGVCLFNKHGLVLVAERRDRRGAWQMPQGGVQADEDHAVAALRELKEEVGTNNAYIIGKLHGKTRYEFPDWLQNRRMSQNGDTTIFRGKYRGQEQEWYALRFVGEDSEIDLSGVHDPETAKNGPEFISWKWVDLAETASLIVPFKKPVYETVALAFAPLADALKRGEEPMRLP